MEYYLSKNDGAYTGPFAPEQLIDNGLERDTMVWREGLTSWLPAYQLPELNNILSQIPPPLEMTLGHMSSNSPMTMPQPLQQVNQPEAAAPQAVESKPAIKTVTVSKNADKPAVKKTAAVTTKKKEETPKAKAKAKTKYNFPVAPWFNESITLLVIIAIHAGMALAGWTTWEYIYLDAAGALLSIIGIVIGTKIKKLNSVSYDKDTPSRILAEKMSKFNGLLVSATAAIGFIIILVQSAHYVYVA